MTIQGGEESMTKGKTGPVRELHKCRPGQAGSKSYSVLVVQHCCTSEPGAEPCHLAANRHPLSLCHEGRVVLTAQGLALAECLG